MELLFWFINQTDTGFIEKQGFNFSPNYKFEVVVEGEKYVLKQHKREKKVPDNFFDDTGCISNITAIVGENGSGKSTLLNELGSLFFYVKDENHEAVYNDYFAERYKKELRVAVFAEDEKLVCYHNIEKLENRTSARTVYLYQNSTTLQKIVVDNEGYENISKIYLTNSSYSLKDNVSTNGSIDKIFLNLDALNTLKDIFYKGNIKRNPSIAGGYFSYLDLCRFQKKASDFQQIIDVLYIRSMYEKDQQGILSKNLRPDLHISFQFYTKVIRDILEKDKKQKEEKNKDILVKAHNGLKSVVENSFIEVLKTDSICIAYFNLLYEIIAYNRGTGFENIGIINSKDNLKSSLELILNNNAPSFFKDAYNEIKEFEMCLSECSQTRCLLPLNDMAYNSKIEIKYGNNSYKVF